MSAQDCAKSWHLQIVSKRYTHRQKGTLYWWEQLYQTMRAQNDEALVSEPGFSQLIFLRRTCVNFPFVTLRLIPHERPRLFVDGRKTAYLFLKNQVVVFQ